MNNTCDVSFLCAISSFIYHISPALVGVLVGGFLVNRFFVKRANLANLVDKVGERLSDLQDDTGEYWSVTYEVARASELAVLESKIKANLLHVASLVQLIGDKHGSKTDRIYVYLVELQKQATGGDFESVSRKADKSRYARIIGLLREIEVSLERLKI